MLKKLFTTKKTMPMDVSTFQTIGRKTELLGGKAFIEQGQLTTEQRITINPPDYIFSIPDTDYNRKKLRTLCKPLEYTHRFKEKIDGKLNISEKTFTKGPHYKVLNGVDIYQDINDGTLSKPKEDTEAELRAEIEKLKAEKAEAYNRVVFDDVGSESDTSAINQNSAVVVNNIVETAAEEPDVKPKRKYTRKKAVEKPVEEESKPDIEEG